MSKATPYLTTLFTTICTVKITTIITTLRPHFSVYLYISLKKVNKYDTWEAELAADEAGDAVLAAEAEEVVLAANDAGRFGFCFGCR